MGLKVSWAKTKVQVFGSVLDETVQSAHACGEDIEILKNFTYLGSVVHNNGGSSLEVARRIGLAHGVMDSQHEYLALSIPVQTDKDSDLQVAGDPCLTLWL